MSAEHWASAGPGVRRSAAKSALAAAGFLPALPPAIAIGPAQPAWVAGAARTPIAGERTEDG